MWVLKTLGLHDSAYTLQQHLTNFVFRTIACSGETRQAGEAVQMTSKTITSGIQLLNTGRLRLLLVYLRYL